MAATVAIFFDLGDTLVIPRLGPGGTVAALEPLPFVAEVLDRLRAGPMAGAVPPRLGVMSNTPATATTSSMRALLTAAGLFSRFDPALLLYSSVEGLTKNDPAFFQRGATRAALPASRCIFVGEDAKEREKAVAAGFRVSFHPLHVFHVLQELP